MADPVLPEETREALGALLGKHKITQRRRLDTTLKDTKIDPDLKDELKALVIKAYISERDCFFEAVLF